MLVLYFLIWSVVFCINSYLTLLLYRTLLVQKVSTPKILIFYLSLNIVHIGITDYLIQSYILKFISMCLVYAATVVFMFEGKAWKKIIVYIENFILILVQEIIMTQIMFGLLKIDWKTIVGYSIGRIGMHFGCTVIAAIIYSIFIYLQNKIQFVISAKKIKYIVICFLSQMVATTIYELIMIELGLESTWIFYAFIICMIISFFVDLYLLNLLSQMEIKEITEQSIEQAVRQDELVAQYYSGVVENINNLERLKESYDRELGDIYKLTDLSYEESENSGYNDNVSDNVLVSNILYNFKRQLNKLNCKYEIDFNIPKDINIESADLSSLIINMFDNAVEALTIYMSKPKKKKVMSHLKAYSQITDGMLIISVENVKSSSQKTRRNDNRYVTSKEKKELHGYGMQIIDKIARKYNGRMKVEYTDTRFSNRVELKV